MHRVISSTIAADGRLVLCTPEACGMHFGQSSLYASLRPRTPRNTSGAIRSSKIFSLEQRQGVLPKRARTQPKSTLAIHDSTSVLASEGALQQSTQLSWKQIQSIALSSAIPMVGFGFMDNFIMIQAGSAIDNTLGVQLGLATMTAAAMGQVVSDTCGVLFGGTLERILGVPFPILTESQKQLAVIPRLRLAAAVAGVIVGCSLGACTLYFMPESQRHEGPEPSASSTGPEEMQRLQRVLNDLLTSANEPWLGRRTSCTLYVNQSMTWSPPSSQNLPVAVASIAQMSASRDSMVLQCFESCEVHVVKNTILIPVMDKQENIVVGVLKLTQGDDQGDEFPFAETETEDAKKLARLLGILMRNWTLLR